MKYILFYHRYTAKFLKPQNIICLEDFGNEKFKIMIHKTLIIFLKSSYIRYFYYFLEYQRAKIVYLNLDTLILSEVLIQKFSHLKSYLTGCIK